MKKFGAKQICLSIVMVGVLLCLMVYLLVFNKYQEETELLESSNAVLEQQVNDLKQYYDNIDLYRKNITEMRATIDQVTADYPGNALEEDTIVKAIDMQSVALVNYERVNIGANNVIHTVSADLVKGLNDENLKSKIDFKARQATYLCTTDYANLKLMVEEVYKHDYRIGINSVSFARDDDEYNFINGTISISFYNLDGMNKEYKKPNMDDYAAGVVDIFGPRKLEGEWIFLEEPTE